MGLAVVNKIRESARGSECQMRVPGICNFNSETTVLAHSNGGGMGKKKLDCESCYVCSDCHDVYDRRTKPDPYDYRDIILMFYEGSERTRAILIDKGLLVLK